MPVVGIYDIGLGYQATYQKTQEIKASEPYLDIAFKGTLYSDKTGDVAYANDEKVVNDVTLTYFTKYLVEPNLEKPEYILNNLYGEDIILMLGALVEE